jgi:hypothetical protein
MQYDYLLRPIAMFATTVVRGLVSTGLEKSVICTCLLALTVSYIASTRAPCTSKNFVNKEGSDNREARDFSRFSYRVQYDSEEVSEWLAISLVSRLAKSISRIAKLAISHAGAIEYSTVRLGKWVLARDISSFAIRQIEFANREIRDFSLRWTKIALLLENSDIISSFRS